METTLARLPWGSGGVASFRDPASGLLLGPRALSVAPDGTVRVADTWGGRVWVLSPEAASGPRAVALRAPDGAFIEADAIAPDGEGGLFIADNLAHAVWHAGPDGRATRFFAAGNPAKGGLFILGMAGGDSGAPIIDAVRFTEREYVREVVRLEPERNGQVVLARILVDERGARVERPGATGQGGTADRDGGGAGGAGAGGAGGTDAGELAGAPVGGGLALAGDGSLFLFEPDPGGTSWRIRRYSPLGELLRTIRVEPGPGAGAAELLGAGPRGEVFLGLGLGTPDGRVVKLDGRGRVLLSVPLPVPEGVPRLGAYAQADAAGNLVVLAPRPEGLVVLSYTLRRVWSFGG